MKTTKIETTLNNFRDGLTSDARLSLRGTTFRFGVGAVPMGAEGRKEMNGELVPGPWALAFELATVMDGTVKDHSADVIVEEGTLLEIDNVVYKVRVDRGQWIELKDVAINELLPVLGECGFQWDAGAECYTHLKYGTLVQVIFREDHWRHVTVEILTAEGLKSEIKFTPGVPTDAVGSFIKTVAKEDK